MSCHLPLNVSVLPKSKGAGTGGGRGQVGDERDTLDASRTVVVVVAAFVMVVVVIAIVLTVVVVVFMLMVIQVLCGDILSGP